MRYNKKENIYSNIYNLNIYMFGPSQFQIQASNVNVIVLGGCKGQYMSTFLGLQDIGSVLTTTPTDRTRAKNSLNALKQGNYR